MDKAIVYYTVNGGEMPFSQTIDTSILTPNNYIDDIKGILGSQHNTTEIEIVRATGNNGLPLRLILNNKRRSVKIAGSLYGTLIFPYIKLSFQLWYNLKCITNVMVIPTAKSIKQIKKPDTKTDDGFTSITECSTDELKNARKSMYMKSITLVLITTLTLILLPGSNVSLFTIVFGLIYISIYLYSIHIINVELIKQNTQ